MFYEELLREVKDQGYRMVDVRNLIGDHNYKLLHSSRAARKHLPDLIVAEVRKVLPLCIKTTRGPIRKLEIALKRYVTLNGYETVQLALLKFRNL